MIWIIRRECFSGVNICNWSKSLQGDSTAEVALGTYLIYLLSGWVDSALWQSSGQFAISWLSSLHRGRVTRLGNFTTVGLLWEAHYDFLKRWRFQTNYNILGCFLLNNFVYIFSKIHTFKTQFVVCILRFQNVEFWTFKLSLGMGYFYIFWIGHSFGFFLKNWVIFSNLLITLLGGFGTLLVDYKGLGQKLS